jgi:hypothetical protein
LHCCVTCAIFGPDAAELQNERYLLGEKACFEQETETICLRGLRGYALALRGDGGGRRQLQAETGTGKPVCQ